MLPTGGHGVSALPPPRTWASVTVGEELPPLVLPMTATRVVAGAIATRDFMPVHHDRDYANSQGAPEIFMNILSDTAYCSRFLTDWAGPEAMVRRIAIRLGVPAFAGSTLTYTGSVTAATVEDGRGLDGPFQVQVEFGLGEGLEQGGHD